MAAKNKVIPKIVEEHDSYVIVQTDVELKSIEKAELFSLANTVMTFLRKKGLDTLDKKLFHVVRITLIHDEIEKVELTSLTDKAKELEQEEISEDLEEFSNSENLHDYLKVFETVYTVSDNEVIQTTTKMLQMFMSFMPTHFEKADSLEEAYQKIRQSFKN